MNNIAILGATGLVGSAIFNKLYDWRCSDYKVSKKNLVFAPTSQDVNLLNYEQTLNYLQEKNITHVYLCAAKVGGIHANNIYPVDFFENNMQIGMNVIKACYKNKVKKLLNLGSTCIFPKECPQPIKEQYLLSGKLEPTNEAYAFAKIGILKLCEYYNKQYGTNFISAMPTNVFGPGDNYHPQNSHVLPAIIRKVHEAKINKEPQIEIWGDGTPIREFIYSGDLADALIFLMENCDAKEGIVNIGTGKGMTILEAYQTVMKVIGYEGEIIFDSSKPNGTPIKITDVSKINALGWKAKISFEEGITKTYESLKKQNFEWKEK